MEQFDVFPAVFSPQRDDLKPDVERWIGWRGIWEAAYVIEEGEYEGQFACVVRPDLHTGQFCPGPEVFAWTPECDLARIGKPSFGEFMAAGSTAIRASMNFEKAMRSVRTPVGAAPTEMQKLSQHVLGVPVDGSVVLAPGEVITDPDRAEQLGLTADARRMRREQGE